jgi:hypothetical protein
VSSNERSRARSRFHGGGLFFTFVFDAKFSNRTEASLRSVEYPKPTSTVAIPSNTAHDAADSFAHIRAADDARGHPRAFAPRRRRLRVFQVRPPRPRARAINRFIPTWQSAPCLFPSHDVFATPRDRRR